MTRKKWTPADDAILCKLLAEKRTDVDIAYITGWHENTIWHRRKRLGLAPTGKRGSYPGWKHTPEARAKSAAANTRRWQDPEFRARHLPRLRELIAAAAAKRFKRPPMGTPEGKRYRKLAETLGPAAARAEFGRVG